MKWFWRIVDGILYVTGGRWLRTDRKAHTMRGQFERVVVDDTGVTRTRPDGKIESIAWSDLHEVSIVTTDEGPWAEDVYWVLVAAEGKSGCAVSHGAEGQEDLLARLQQLPGFRNDEVIRAMGSTSNARFVCWRRE